MPKLNSKTKVLDGRGTVVSYATDPSIYYYRESNGSGGYRSIKLKAKSEGDAVLEALDAYTAFRQLPVTDKPKPRRKTKKTITSCVAEWLSDEQNKLDAGLIGDSDFNNKRNASKHLLTYLEAKEISSTSQLTENTLDEYPVFAQKRSPLTVKNEIGFINGFFTWLKKRRLIAPDVAALRMTPVVRITGEDLQANPAINLEDWRIIYNEVHRRIKESKNNKRLHPSVYWWTTFYNFIMIMKNSGLRPGELRRLTWRDVTIIDAGQRSKSDKRHHYIAELNVKRTKTGEPRQVPTKSGERFLDLQAFQQDYLDKYYGGMHQVNKDDLVFANYARCGGKVVSHHQYKKAWGEVRTKVANKLKGHWSSDHNYTLYSLRSSFIEDSLMDDVPVNLVAQMTGHDIKVLMKHYSQLDVRRRTLELAKLPIGQKKDDTKKVINLFD